MPPDSHPLYERISPWLGVFERKQTHRQDSHDRDMKENDYDVILFGLGRFGAEVEQVLRQRGYQVLGVDYDPDLVRRHEDQGYAVRYGDAEDPEFIASLPLSQVSWVLSSIPERHINLVLLHSLREQDYKGSIAVTAHTSADTERLQDAGANQVLIPYFAAAAEAIDKLFGENKQHPVSNTAVKPDEDVVLDRGKLDEIRDADNNPSSGSEMSDVKPFNKQE